MPHSETTPMKWWMRAVGVFYLLLFVMAAWVKMPIRVEGPEGVLARAAEGDPTARFVEDVWVTLGLELGAVGAALLVASRVPERARALVWAVCGMEVAGILADLYKLARGYAWNEPTTWVFIHLGIISAGIYVLRRGARHSGLVVQASDA